VHTVPKGQVPSAALQTQGFPADRQAGARVIGQVVENVLGSQATAAEQPPGALQTQRPD
jgi:hypothetical protein